MLRPRPQISDLRSQWERAAGKDRSVPKELAAGICLRDRERIVFVENRLGQETVAGPLFDTPPELFTVLSTGLCSRRMNSSIRPEPTLEGGNESFSASNFSRFESKLCIKAVEISTRPERSGHRSWPWRTRSAWKRESKEEIKIANLGQFFPSAFPLASNVD